MACGPAPRARRAAFERLTSQPYLSNSPYLDSDVANAVKPELIIELKREDGADGAVYTASYDFRLAPT